MKPCSRPCQSASRSGPAAGRSGGPILANGPRRSISASDRSRYCGQVSVQTRWPSAWARLIRSSPSFVLRCTTYTGCPVYVVHLSTKLGLERIKRAQAEGQRVWTETCPQYLLLSDAEMERLGPFAKIGPPLRPAAGPDREALWQGLEQGFIATVASDHSPRMPSVKEPGWKNIFVYPDGKPIPFGAPSLETLVPLIYSEGVTRRGLPVTWLARVLAENPARIFGLYPRKGAIRVGADADLTIIDPDPETTITVQDHKGIAGWTLYEGWKARGRPWMTLLRGEVLLDRGRLMRPAGYGQFLRRGVPVPPLGGAAR